MPGVVAAAHAPVLLLDQPHVRDSARARSATVPSVEPWSTTTTSRPRTDSRHCSIHGSAFQVTTTTVTSGRFHRAPQNERPTDVLPEDHEHSPGSASRIVIRKNRKPHANASSGGDAELAEEADEERLAHAEAVDGERHEHDEEEQRAEHDVRAAARGGSRPRGPRRRSRRSASSCAAAVISETPRSVPTWSR